MANNFLGGITLAEYLEFSISPIHFFVSPHTEAGTSHGPGLDEICRITSKLCDVPFALL